jgi:hypothetical protein
MTAIPWTNEVSDVLDDEKAKESGKPRSLNLSVANYRFTLIWGRSFHGRFKSRYDGIGLFSGFMLGLMPT